MEDARAVDTAFGLGEGGASLVRPDGYIAWRAIEFPEDPRDTLHRAFAQVSFKYAGAERGVMRPRYLTIDRNSGRLARTISRSFSMLSRWRAPFPVRFRNATSRTLEPDESVLRRRLRQAPVVVFRIDRDIDAVRPVLQSREDIAGLGEPWRLGVFDEGDVVRCIGEQPLVVRQQSGAGRGLGSHDLDLPVQELALGDEPERQARQPA